MSAGTLRSKANVDEDAVAAAFHPVEAAIVRNYLGLPPRSGDAPLDIRNHASELPDDVVHLVDTDSTCSKKAD